MAIQRLGPDVIGFGSSPEEFDEVMEMIAENSRQLDKQLTPDMAELEPPFYYIRRYETGYGVLIIYGKALPDEEWREPDEPELNDNFVMTRSYSKACPDGEFGSVHKTTMSGVLTKDQFEFFQERGWPDEAELFELGYVFGVRE